jgi:uncharacterized membrane protein YkvA (DUF1232 family)
LRHTRAALGAFAAVRSDMDACTATLAATPNRGSDVAPVLGANGQQQREEPTMSSTLTANLQERIDESVLRRVREDVQSHAPATGDSRASSLRGRLWSFLEEGLAKRLGQRELSKLVENRGQVTATWNALPARMHLVANQTKLMLELVDDFRAGTYRKLPWHSLAICAAAILYAASPADLLPDVVLGLGVLDDVAVAALAARALRKDLTAYCAFKGYPIEDYFPTA